MKKNKKYNNKYNSNALLIKTIRKRKRTKLKAIISSYYNDILKMIIIIIMINTINISFSNKDKKIELNKSIYKCPKYREENEKSKYIKPIILYYPKINPLFNNKDILNNLSYIEEIKNHIKVAKLFCIYGFGIFYYWEPNNIIFNIPLDLIIENRNLKIKFLLIWKNEEKAKYNLTNKDNTFILDIKKYLLDKRYIRINQKPIIGIYNPNITNISQIIWIWRENAKKFIGKLFILSACYGNNIKILNEMKLFDGFFDISSYNTLSHSFFNGKFYYFYYYLLYKNLDLNLNYNQYKEIIYRSSHIISNYTKYLERENIYSDYTPTKYYHLNKIIIEWTKQKYEYNRYIFINSFDNEYLNIQNKLGYESLNYLKQALYNYSEKENYNILALKSNCLVAIQAHIFYIDLLNEIINKTNNIPVKFDLYISTDSEEKKNLIGNAIKNSSKANDYNILVVENRGRDVLPLLIQLKMVINKYKYFCHIHTKKSIGFSGGNKWRQYFYNNLLGNENIISGILSAFENYDKLGFIYPETFYQTLPFTIEEKQYNIKNINYLLNKISPGYKVGNKIEFPAGNMFWARTAAVYQVFGLNISELVPKEPIKIDGTILHAIERIWISIVKLNGYYYKKIINYI